jgi:preprotein translocase subunit SecF
MDIVRHRRIYLLISLTLVIGSLVLLAVPPGLKAGIDFTGGAALSVAFDGPVTSTQVTDAMTGLGHPEAVVQATGENGYFIRLGELTLDQRDADGNITTPGDETRVRDALAGMGGTVESLDTVSGVIGSENVRNAAIAVVVATVVILFYVTWAFRRVPSPFRYGTAAIIALVHDTVIVLGVFSMLGKVAGLEVNAMFITGVLTVIGYSVNDTIVVFDRLRENTTRMPGLRMAELVNVSVRETVARSLNTSITLLIVVLGLALFAGAAIRPLLYVMLAGVTVGTYSSIFIASLILVAWEEGELGRAFRRIPLVGGRAR